MKIFILILLVAVSIVSTTEESMQDEDFADRLFLANNPNTTVDLYNQTIRHMYINGKVVTKVIVNVKSTDDQKQGKDDGKDGGKDDGKDGGPGPGGPGGGGGGSGGQQQNLIAFDAGCSSGTQNRISMVIEKTYSGCLRSCKLTSGCKVFALQTTVSRYGQRYGTGRCGLYSQVCSSYNQYQNGTIWYSVLEPSWGQNNLTREMSKLKIDNKYLTQQYQKVDQALKDQQKQNEIQGLEQSLKSLDPNYAPAKTSSSSSSSGEIARLEKIYAQLNPGGSSSVSTPTSSVSTGSTSAVNTGSSSTSSTGSTSAVNTGSSSTSSSGLTEVQRLQKIYGSLSSLQIILI